MNPHRRLRDAQTEARQQHPRVLPKHGSMSGPLPFPPQSDTKYDVPMLS
jgi:hypothetical protein